MRDPSDPHHLSGQDSPTLRDLEHQDDPPHATPWPPSSWGTSADPATTETWHSPQPVAAAPAVRRERIALHLVLLAASLYTMTLAGAFNAVGSLAVDPAALGKNMLLNPTFLALGLPYSLCLLAILGVHEMGHYLACRRYGVDATLPYFLPSFPVPIGTFGAFIRIRAPFPNRKVLFDVGIAGPIAGFMVALPVLVYGIVTATPVPMPESAGAVGEPLLLTWLTSWLSPTIPDGYAVMLSGPLMAGWVGCLATAINLFPIGQLDGGHVCYAVSARFHWIVSIVTLVGFITLGLLIYPGWLFFATMLVMFGPKHPPVLDGAEGLSTGRLIVAGLAFVILLVCFIPQPFPLS